jgi:hypothetical protein
VKLKIKNEKRKMKIIQSALFRRKVKKFQKNQKLRLDEHIHNIMENPGIGQEKKGDCLDYSGNRDFVNFFVPLRVLRG